MITFEEACKIAYRDLKANGYSGIGSIRGTKDFWTFGGAGKDPGYCCEGIIIFADDEKNPPQILQWHLYMDLYDEIKSAKKIEVPEEYRS